jgi:protein-disulfide isomerase
MSEETKAIMIGGVAMLAGAAGAVFFMGGATAPAAIPGKVQGVDRAAIEQIVHDYILAHPEILPEAMENLERKQAAAAVQKHKPSIQTAFGTAWEGAADPDVTLVEFFDYACGYCRASRPEIDKLLAEDKKLRIVYRELPILGPASEDAAKLSLAVAKMGGNYAAFHRAVYAGGRPSSGVLNSALGAAQVDAGKAKSLAASPEVAQEIAANLELQRTLRLTGTPSWVAGDRVVVGAVGYDELKKLIAEQRAGK